MYIVGVQVVFVSGVSARMLLGYGCSRSKAIETVYFRCGSCLSLVLDW